MAQVRRCDETVQSMPDDADSLNQPGIYERMRSDPVGRNLASIPNRCSFQVRGWKEQTMKDEPKIRTATPRNGF